jgi:TRAP-type C4-dicarboxylate transport system permease small subunit
VTQKKPVWVRSINMISEVSGYISGMTIFLATLVILHQVIVRYFIGESTIWQTEFSIYLLLFASFVGAAYGLKHDAHVGVDVIVERMPQRAKSILRIVTSIFSLLLTIIVAWKAWEMWAHATSLGWHSSSIWGPPLTYPYFILPLGMSLVSLQFIVIIYEEYIKLVNNKKTKIEIDGPSKTM